MREGPSSGISREAEREREQNIEALRGSFFAVNGILNEDDLRRLDADEAQNLARIAGQIPAERAEAALVGPGLVDAAFVRDTLAQTSAPGLQTTMALVLNRLALNTSARPGMREKVAYLIEAGVLSRQTLPLLFSPNPAFFNAVVNKGEKWWRTEIETGRLDPGAINPINWGRAIEFNDPHRAVMPRSSRIRPHQTPPFQAPEPVKPRDDSTHYVLNTFLAREHLEKLGAQVEAVVPPDSALPPREALEKLFEHYAKESPEYERMSHEEAVPSAERADNIKAVNAWQETFLKDNGRFSADERFAGDEARRHRTIDLYARIDPVTQKWGDMDQFQLAIIAKTVDWYIKNGHSRLFDRIRIVPDRRIHSYDKEIAAGTVPLSALLAAPGATVLKESGQPFKDSFTFANRFFLTHSRAREAAEYGSIPLIGWGVFWNPLKRWRLRDIAALRAQPDRAVVFRGLFNADDLGARIKKPLIPPAVMKLGTVIKTGGEVSYDRADAAGNIAYLIDETLRSLRELEEREIERAEGRKEA